jgi:alpha-N-acetylglucosamine transferase
MLCDYNKFFSKLEILNYENYEDYENFLYLDADAFVIKNINNIFDKINSDKKNIHGVKEKFNINENINDYFFRFSTKIYQDNDLFNFGTFGFNIKMTDSLNEFKKYIENNINYAKIDQSLYNEFFAGEKRNIIPTLSEYVYLGENNNMIYKDINKISYQDAKIIHLLGNYCNGQSKIDKAKLLLTKFL